MSNSYLFINLKEYFSTESHCHSSQKSVKLKIQASATFMLCNWPTDLVDEINSTKIAKDFVDRCYDITCNKLFGKFEGG